MYILKNAFGIFWLWELGFRLTRLGSQEISHRFWGNPSPILGKSATDLGEIVTDFGKICHRFWGNPSPFLGSSVFGKTGSVFWDKLVRFGGKLVWFLDWLGTKLKSHCFER